MNLGQPTSRRDRQPPKMPTCGPQYNDRLQVSLDPALSDLLGDIRREWGIPKTYMTRGCLELVLGSEELLKRALGLAIDHLRRDDEMRGSR